MKKDLTKAKSDVDKANKKALKTVEALKSMDLKSKIDRKLIKAIF